MLPGGVCAVLDYEVDQMTDYVAEMAQRVVLPLSPVSPAFRKFVSGLLTSTRLPSTTILLGMNYLARRTGGMKLAGAPKATDGQVWRMLTISLLLGSKFLDDNTFQNRSWSEVSGIPVAELNTLESEWLEAMNWTLYVNLDESDDFNAWLGNWDDWRATKNLQRKATLERLAPLPLAPIDTNVQGPRPYPQPFSGYPSKRVAVERPQSGINAPYDQNSWMSSYPTPQLTPPSSNPDSGVNTPDYLSATGGGPRFNDWSLYNQYQRYQAGPVPGLATSFIPTRLGYSPTRIAKSYQNRYTDVYDRQYGSNGNIWDSGDCNCGHCKVHSKYLASHGWGPHGYGQQILAG